MKMIPHNGDKWWALLIVLMCIFFSLNITTEMWHRRETFEQRAGIIDTQQQILTNQYFIMQNLGYVKVVRPEETNASLPIVEK